MGVVTTGAAGTSASATLTGTAPSQTLNLTVPAGEQGARGPAGPNTIDTGTATPLSGYLKGNGGAVSATVSIPQSDVTNLSTALAAKEASANKNQANGYAGLDGAGLVPAALLPSYVDDVLEYANLAGFPGTGETGKIYVDRATGKIYRWSGSVYVEISPSPGSTDSVTEGVTNLYFTEARVRGSVLTGLTAAASLVVPAATDSMLTAWCKVLKYLNSLGTAAYQAVPGNGMTKVSSGNFAAATKGTDYLAGEQNAKVVALTDAASIAVDATLGNHFRVTLAGNRTLANPTGATDGQRMVFEIIQDGTGSRTLAFGNKFVFGTTIASITLTTTASKRDMIAVVYNSSADKFYVVGFAAGF
jgi:hypothetical protein